MILLFFSLLIGLSPFLSFFDIVFIKKDIITIIAFIGAVLLLFNIVSESQKQSNVHNNFKNRYYDILIKLNQKEPEEYSIKELNELNVSRLCIDKEVPPINFVLNALCYNKIVRSTYKSSEELKKFLIRIPWYKSKTYLLINWTL
jgi:hypothetical protein